MSDPGNFTVKEILTDIVIPELKAIRASADQKADRVEVLAMDTRLKHVEAVAGDFPFVVNEKITLALKDYDTSAKTKSERQFSHRDRILFAVLGVIGAIATVVYTAVLIVSASGGGT